MSPGQPGVIDGRRRFGEANDLLDRVLACLGVTLVRRNAWLDGDERVDHLRVVIFPLRSRRMSNACADVMAARYGRSDVSAIEAVDDRQNSRTDGNILTGDTADTRCRPSFRGGT